MPRPRNKNDEFLALPVSGRNELAEMDCALCDETASVRRHNDGWIEVYCECGYSESATKKPSFDKLMVSVLNDDSTVFRRTNKDDVSRALGIVETEPLEADETPNPEQIETEKTPKPEPVATVESPKPEPLEGPDENFEDDDEDEVERMMAGE